MAHKPVQGVAVHFFRAELAGRRLARRRLAPELFASIAHIARIGRCGMQPEDAVRVFLLRYLAFILVRAVAKRRSRVLIPALFRANVEVQGVTVEGRVAEAPRCTFRFACHAEHLAVAHVEWQRLVA